jgi:Uri superfamily endonuclease
MTSSRFPNKPGVYTLILAVAAAATLPVGVLGTYCFPAGHYTYTGSALGARSMTLRNRIHRHLTREKRTHWHIDYLLASEVSRVKAVLFTETAESLECPVATAIAGLGDAEIVVKGFGSSDCQGGCLSHLCFFPQTPYPALVGRIAAIYRYFGTTHRVDVDMR